MSTSINSYEVTVMKKEMVAALLPLQEHRHPLSNLDLLLPHVHFGVFFCFKNPWRFSATDEAHRHEIGNFSDVVDRLKVGLAKALVHYYVLAGEVVVGDYNLGEPELLCNNRGVEFVEAAANVELHDMRLCDPDDAVEDKLLPKNKDGVLCVQVTELRCGGIIVGCTFDHRVADAYSANMFIASWAAAAAGMPISNIPSFSRNPLTPRRPGYYSDSIDRLYVPLSSLPPPPPPSDKTSEDDEDNKPINRIYYVSAKEIQRIQAAASGGGRRSSKLEAFSVYLWKIIGKASKTASEQCMMGIVVDGRTRFSAAGGVPSMDSYFGNVLSIPFGGLRMEDLEEMEVSEVADVVRGFLKEGLTEEHFRGMIDWVEERRPQPALARIYCHGGGGGSRATTFVVSSGQRFPVREVDFGWGLPAFGSYHFPWGGTAGYIMPMPSPKTTEMAVDDWVVYVHLARRLVKAIEDDDGGVVFQPLMAHHIGLTPSTTAAVPSSGR